uniref:Putative secreted protein n=1 Tax=Ixodes scapularis TaxID=6945 RepID=A0A4D5RAN1_IXOSC
MYTFAPSRDVLFFASFALPVFVSFLLASFFAHRVLCRSTEISRFPGCAKEKGNPTLLCTDLFLLSPHGRATYHSTGTEQLGWACWREYYYYCYYYYYYYYTHTHYMPHDIQMGSRNMSLFFKRA